MAQLKQGKMLYITSSSTLVESTEKEYLRLAELHLDLKVEFKTIEAVIKQQAPETQKLAFVGENNFKNWYKNI